MEIDFNVSIAVIRERKCHEILFMPADIRIQKLIDIQVDFDL